MKHFKGIMIAICMILSMQTLSAKSVDLERDKPIPAKVMEVIESNVYKLLVYDGVQPRIALYKLIGVKSDGNRAGYKYSESKLLNQTVYILEDSKIPANAEISYCYLFHNFDISHNEDLISRGLATVDEGHLAANQYPHYKGENQAAKRKSIGMYHFSDRPVTDRILNINTASIEQMAAHFGVEPYKAGRWHAAISSNPINSLAELRAVDKDFFDFHTLLEYAPSIHMRTNLIAAYPYELASLTGRLTDSSATTDKILEFRLDKEKIDEVVYHDLAIPEMHRKLILPFITFENDVYRYINKKNVININTASAEQLENTFGIGAYYALGVHTFGKDLMYPLRNKEELYKQHFPLHKFQKDMCLFEDRFHLMTDINSAQQHELKSLFGKFSLSAYQLLYLAEQIEKKRPFRSADELEKVIGKKYVSAIKPYIYFDKLPVRSKLNLNTSGRELIAKELHLRDAEKKKLPKTILNPKEIPSFLNKHMDKITLYTNINQADETELYYLHSGMSKELVKEIILQRQTDDFYILDDIEEIFRKHKRLDTFQQIKDYIVLK